MIQVSLDKDEVHKIGHIERVFVSVDDRFEFVFGKDLEPLFVEHLMEASNEAGKLAFDGFVEFIIGVRVQVSDHVLVGHENVLATRNQLSFQIGDIVVNREVDVQLAQVSIVSFQLVQIGE